MDNYSFNSNVILRTPLFPFVERISREELILFFGDDVVKEAIFLSSPDLFNELKRWEALGFQNYPKEDKLLASLMKYAVRMRSRCTPFGLFAGCNIVDGLPKEIVISKNRARKTRLDMNFSGKLGHELSRHKDIRKHLNFFPNTSIYVVQDQIRYIEYVIVKGNRSYQISAVENNEYVQLILEKSKNGIKISDLVALLFSEEISREDALSFVEEIIEAQLLVSELEPGVTGDELVDRIIETIKKIHLKHANKDIESTLNILIQTKSKLVELDENIGNPIGKYLEISENLKQLNIPVELNRLFQTDLFPNYWSKDENDTSTTFFKTYERQIIDAATVLNKLKVHRDTNLKEFKDKFKERYDSSEVPLMEALDSELGIGYARNTNVSGDISPLINGLVLPRTTSEYNEMKWGRSDTFLLKKLIKATKEGARIIEIAVDELDDFTTNWNDLSESMSIMVDHIGEREGKPFFHLKSIGSSSAINYLGRFAQGNTSIKAFIRNIALKEQDNCSPNILAEIVHLPENRTGNILQRPVFRAYEIPYLAASSVSKENQFGMDDLLLEIKDDDLILKSKKKNMRIFPRLGNAHNYSYKSLPVYNFLCDLQFQNKRPGLLFDWGPLVDEFTFLPRVEVGNVVVSKARWQLNKEDYKEILNINSELVKVVKVWRERWEMPDLIQLVDGDNQLFINLSDALSLEMFASTIKNRKRIVLQEFLFSPDFSIVQDSNGKPFRSELIFSLEKKKPGEGSKSQILNNDQLSDSYLESKLPASFSVGSEWFYIKIYCGIKSSDNLLVSFVQPFVSKSIKEGLIDKWFFIRYFDPDFHLRIRFHFNDLTKIGDFLKSFNQEISAYEKSGYIRNIQVESYKREIERYGYNTINQSENLFHYSSNLTTGVIGLLEGLRGEELRWLCAFRIVDVFLSCFEFEMNNKLEFMEGLKLGFGAEFAIDKNLKLQLDKKYRSNKQSISSIIKEPLTVSNEIMPLIDMIEEYKIIVDSEAKKILTIRNNELLGLNFEDWIASHIHMILNRLFRNNQRLHELVVYDSLWRFYRSELAKQRNIEKLVGL